MEMANYILSILRSDFNTVFSWGFHRPIALENGLRFYVNGFKHKGTVTVIYNEGADLFDIELHDMNNKLVEKIEGVYFDEMVYVIDNQVEMIANYEEAVQREYPNLIISNDEKTNK